MGPADIAMSLAFPSVQSLVGKAGTLPDWLFLFQGALQDSRGIFKRFCSWQHSSSLAPSYSLKFTLKPGCRALQRLDDEPREVRQGEEFQAVSIPEVRPRPRKLTGEEAARLAAQPILQPGSCGPAGQPAPLHTHPLPPELHAFFGIGAMGFAGEPDAGSGFLRLSIVQAEQTPAVPVSAGFCLPLADSADARGEQSCYLLKYWLLKKACRRIAECIHALSPASSGASASFPHAPCLPASHCCSARESMGCFGEPESVKIPFHLPTTPLLNSHISGSQWTESLHAMLQFSP